MKTAPQADQPAATTAAPIVALAAVVGQGPAGQGADSQGAAALAEAEHSALQRARVFAEPLLVGRCLDTGEDALAHADGVADILQAIGAGPGMRAAAYLVYAGDFLQKPEEVVAKAFGDSYAGLVAHTRKLVQIQRAAREAQVEAEQRAQQTERVRKMLLAFSRDLRVVLLRLASRLQTLRWYAATKTDCPQLLAQESQQVFAPLANRLGIWQIKWEMEDLAFRFLQPADYKRLAQALAEKRVAARNRHRGSAQPAAGRAGQRRHRGPGAGPAQAPLQHLEEDARQGPWRWTGCSTCARCASSWPMCLSVMPRCRACMNATARCRTNTTTTSPGPRPTATRACTPWCCSTSRPGRPAARRGPACRSADPHHRHA